MGVITAMACASLLGSAVADETALRTSSHQQQTAYAGHPHPTVMMPRGDYITDHHLDQMRRHAPAANSPMPPMYYSQPAMAQPQMAFLLEDDRDAWHFQLLPGDVIWQSYWAGAKEPRMSTTFFRDLHSETTLTDVTLGARSSIVRFGNHVDGRPEGWELQLEGAGMLRLNLSQDWDYEAADFRVGAPLVYGRGKWQFKFSHYHLSSHMGDEYAIRTGLLNERINFSRDVLVVGVSFFPLPSWRWYAEAGWAFYADEGTEPWEFQFGVDWALRPGATGASGTPFAAVNGHLREEVNFGGNLAVQAGWLWRGESGRNLRAGLHYYNGKSSQFQFFDQFEQQIGMGIWHDF